MMMNRAFCRVFRGTCRKWRENDCPPVAVGEEVRKNKDQSSEKEFVPPPKHSWGEAVTWTSGLVLGYQLTHGRRRKTLLEDNPPASATSLQSACPFTKLAARVITQPVIHGHSTQLNVSRRCAVVPSIDVTPFILEDIEELPGRFETPTVVEDDDIVFASEQDSLLTDSKDVVTLTGSNQVITNPADYGEKYAADLLSVLGAFEFLKMELEPKGEGPQPQRKPRKRTNSKSSRRYRLQSSSSTDSDPPIHALELMKKGAELGSGRALYNLGVAYERMNEVKLAREYYKKAADVGHPLATYNCAVFALRDGHLTEGVALMKTASDFGVPEAAAFMKPSEDSLIGQFELGRV